MKHSTHFSALALTTKILLGTATISQAAATLDPAIQLAENTKTRRDGTYTGAAYDAYWGQVRVSVTIQSGRLIAIDVPEYPKHRNTSRSINRQALPLLQQEVISAQSTKVNLISGATLTSKAYLSSLKSALKKAGG